jgi:hypothetical protein
MDPTKIKLGKYYTNPTWHIGLSNQIKRAYPIDQKWRKFMYDHGLGNPTW